MIPLSYRVLVYPLQLRMTVAINPSLIQGPRLLRTC